MLSLAAFVLAPSTAHAWKYPEHLRIGRQSFRCACLWLGQQAQAVSRDIDAKDIDACGASPLAGRDAAEHPLVLSELEKNLVRELACKDLDDDAFSYGQSTALAGDHLEAPRDFEQVQGERDMVSLLEYARRALGDGDHYHPRAPIRWHEYHQKAVEHAQKVRAAIARTAGNEINEEVRRLFVEALHISGFADHFLQDSFAAGHMGFGRGATRPTAAMVYHDKQNYRGRLVRDRNGEVFWTHGDGALHWRFSGSFHVLRAASESVFDVMLTAVTNQQRADVDRDVSNRIPVAYLETDILPVEELNDYGRKNGHYRTAMGRWVPTSALHDPAQVSLAPGIEYRHATALTERSYDRDQLTLIMSEPFDRTFGFRFDFGLGVDTSPLRGDSAMSIHQRVGMTFPLYASYESVLGYDLGFGGVIEECVTRCNRMSSDDGIDPDGLFTGYLALRLNVEAGKLVLLQTFIEGLGGVDFGGAPFGGIAIGVVLSKPVKTNEPTPFSGPPI